LAELGSKEPPSGESSFDTSRYAIDSKPLSRSTELELLDRLHDGDIDARVLIKQDGIPFAVLVKPGEFSLLVGLLELAHSIPYYVRRSLNGVRDHLTIDTFFRRTNRS
jgi:hypothetical protein